MKNRLRSLGNRIQRLTGLSARELCLALLLTVQVILIIDANLTRTSLEMDCDSAKLMRHITAMWEEKTLVIPGWQYLTTLEWDCTTLLALPFYALTGNIFLACGISNVLQMFILILTVFFLFREKERLYPLLCANLLCIPYHIGQLDYFNMMFFGGAQYIVKVTIPLLLVAILLNGENQDACKKSRRLSVFTFLYFFLLLVSCASSSIYVTACGLIPIWLVYLAVKFFRWESISRKNWVLLGGTAICSIFGAVVNKAVMGGIKSTGMILCDVLGLSENVRTCFLGLFALMGATTETGDLKVFSFWGIAVVGKFVFVLLLLGCGVITAARCLKNKGSLRSMLLLGVFVWNLFILCVCNTHYGSALFEYRYHLIGMIPLICVAADTILDGLKRICGKQQKILFAGGVMAVAFLAAVSFRELFMRGEQNPELKEFVRGCQSIEQPMIYMLGDESGAEICRILDDTHEYLFLTHGGNTLAFDYYEYYNGVAMERENVAVAVPDPDGTLGDTYEIAGIPGVTLYRIGQAGGRSIYCFSQP